MPRRNLAGAHTALVTPFLPDLSVDWAGLDRLLAFQIDQGITGLVPAGTTGESPTLDWPEHNRVIDAVLRAAAQNCYVIAGTGSNSTAEALHASQHAAEMGTDALLLVDCYYNGPSSRELRSEYHAVIARACPDCTVIPYIIPGRVGAALAPEDLALLAAECPNVSAVKEATGDVDRMAFTRSLVGPDFDILSGDDNITASIMLDPRIRAQGVISVVSNVAPAAVAQLVNAAFRSDATRADKLNEALGPLFDIVTVLVEDPRRMPDGSVRSVRDKFRNPLPIKTLMSALGMPAGPARQPLGRISRNGLEIIRTAARTVWDRNPWILEPVEEAFAVTIPDRLADDRFWLPLASAD